MCAVQGLSGFVRFLARNSCDASFPMICLRNSIKIEQKEVCKTSKRNSKTLKRMLEAQSTKYFSTSNLHSHSLIQKKAKCGGYTYKYGQYLREFEEEVKNKMASL